MTLRRLGIMLTQYANELTAGINTGPDIDLSYAEKLEIYLQAIKQTLVYKKARNIRFYKRTSYEYHDLWSDSTMKSYHNSFLFGRQLGFDLLSFTPLSDSIFKLQVSMDKNGNYHYFSEYIRHHYKLDSKISLLLQDLLLTNINNHRAYEALGESKTLVLIKGFEKMLKDDGTGPNGRWTRSDLQRLFTGEDSWVLYDKKNGWFSNPKFDDFLSQFNNRRDTFRQEGLEALITKYNYDTLYNRFFTKFERDNNRFMMYVVSNPLQRTLSDIIASDYYMSKTPDLLNYFNTHPSIFINWFSD